MKARAISIIFFLGLFYLVPLLPKLELILTPQMIFLVLVCLILLYTQPAISIQEGKVNRLKDQYTMWLIMFSVAFIQIAMIIEWAYIRKNFILFSWDFLTIIGTIFLIAGSIFRIWCINILGKSFTAVVKTHSTQQLIQSGPYRYIRHPSYLGAYLAIIGSTVLMHTFVATILAILLMLVVYHFRIRYEEKALIEEFGEQYQLYQISTRRLIPFVY